MILDTLRQHYKNCGFADPAFDAQKCQEQAQKLAHRWSAWQKQLSQSASILIFGDYDADGILASVLAQQWLTQLGHKTHIFIPSRLKHGYGFCAETLQQVPHTFNALLILDSGTHALADLPSDIPVLVIDHHEANGITDDPRLINPKVLESPDPVLATLCTGGLMQMLIHQCAQGASFQELRNTGKALSAITTITDVCPMHRFHRKLVREGLGILNGDHCPPALKCLQKAAGMQSFNAFTLGWVIGPILNAPGRIQNAQVVIDFLQDPSPKGAQSLRDINQSRKDYTLNAVTQVLHTLKPPYPQTLIVWDPDWSPGLVGLIAARMAQYTQCCTLALGFNADRGIWQGSGRAPSGFHLLELVHEAKDLLLSYGGHESALGLACTSPEKLRDRLQHKTAPLTQVREWKPFPCRLEDLTAQLAQQLENLGPFGHDWPEPHFCPQDAHLAHFRLVRKGGQALLKGPKGELTCYIPEQEVSSIETLTAHKAPAPPITLRWDPKWGINLVMATK